MARFEFERGFFIGVLLRLQFFFFSLFSSHCLPFKPSQTSRFGLIDPCSGLIQMLTGHNCHVNHSVVCFDGFRKNSVLIQLRNFFQCPFFPMGIGMACSRKGKMKLLVFFFLFCLPICSSYLLMHFWILDACRALVQMNSLAIPLRDQEEKRYIDNLKLTLWYSSFIQTWPSRFYFWIRHYSTLTSDLFVPDICWT